MHAEKVIARAIIEMAKEELKAGSISDISDRIHDYKQRGQDVFGITLQKTPLGFHSQEVAAFVGRIVAAGLGTQTNPVILTKEGIEWLKTFIGQD